MVIGLRADTMLIAAAGFLYLLGAPIANGCNQAIWQSEVATHLQGRVFAMRRMVALSVVPLAYVTAGPVADTLFEPLLAVGGPLAGSVGQVIGVGPGRGIGFLFIILGVLVILSILVAAANSSLRNVESTLPP